MAKFHINNAGEAGSCRAEKGGCPFGSDDQHYPTAAEASQAYENKMADHVVPEPVEREANRERPLPNPEKPLAKETPTEEFKRIERELSENHDRLLRLTGRKDAAAEAEREEIDEIRKVLADAYQVAYRNLPDYQAREDYKKSLVVEEDIRKVEGDIKYLHNLSYAPRQKGESRAAYKIRKRRADGGEMMPAEKRIDGFLGMEEWDPAQPGYKIQLERKTAQLRKLQDEVDVLQGREPSKDRPPLNVKDWSKESGGLRGFFSRF